MANELIAFQCFPVRILGDGWSVCAYGFVAHPDERREQGGVWDYFSRKVGSGSYDLEEAHANLIIEHSQTMSSVPSSYTSSASTSSISIAIPYLTHTSGREDVLVVKMRRLA